MLRKMLESISLCQSISAIIELRNWAFFQAGKDHPMKFKGHNIGVRLLVSTKHFQTSLYFLFLQIGSMLGHPELTD